LLLYAVASLFAAGEATPVIGVHFFIFLALLAATLCPQQSIHDATSTQTVHASSFSMSASRWTARLILCVGVASVVCATPWLVRTGRAHLIYDRALQTTSLPRRVALLRQARDLDLEQPIYWAQLAQAQLSMHGTPVARAATNVYRAAALRSPNDALFWHNIAALFGTAGDATNVIRNETRAMLADLLLRLIKKYWRKRMRNWATEKKPRLTCALRAIPHARPPKSRHGANSCSLPPPALCSRNSSLCQTPAR
jgi:hypothetical protein